MLQRNWIGLFHCDKQQRSLKEAPFSNDKVAHSTKPIFLALFPVSWNCRYPGLNLSISLILDSFRAKATYLAKLSSTKKMYFFYMCAFIKCQTWTIFAWFQNTTKMKTKNRVTTVVSDSREDLMVQHDKDVDALMHLKITVVELYKRLLSRFDQSPQNGKILQDWIGDMLWRMKTMMT